MQITGDTKTLRNTDQKQDSQNERYPLASSVEHCRDHDDSKKRAGKSVFGRNFDLKHEQLMHRQTLGFFLDRLGQVIERLVKSD